MNHNTVLHTNTYLSFKSENLLNKYIEHIRQHLNQYSKKTYYENCLSINIWRVISLCLSSDKIKPEMFCILILKLFLRALWCNSFKQNFGHRRFFSSHFFSTCYRSIRQTARLRSHQSGRLPLQHGSSVFSRPRQAVRRQRLLQTPPGLVDLQLLLSVTTDQHTATGHRVWKGSLLKVKHHPCSVPLLALANALSDVAFLQLKSGFAQLFWLGFTWASKAVSKSDFKIYDGKYCGSSDSITKRNIQVNIWFIPW